MVACSASVLWCTLLPACPEETASSAPLSTAKGAEIERPSANVANSGLVCARIAIVLCVEGAEGLSTRNPHRNTVLPAGYITCGPTALDMQPKQIDVNIMGCGGAAIGGGSYGSAVRLPVRNRFEVLRLDNHVRSRTPPSQR